MEKKKSGILPPNLCKRWGGGLEDSCCTNARIFRPFRIFSIIRGDIRGGKFTGIFSLGQEDMVQVYSSLRRETRLVRDSVTRFSTSGFFRNQFFPSP
jgi:hypothetical protein